VIESLSERAGTLNSWGLPTEIDVLLGKGRVADVSVFLSQAASRSKWKFCGRWLHGAGGHSCQWSAVSLQAVSLQLSAQHDGQLDPGYWLKADGCKLNAGGVGALNLWLRAACIGLGGVGVPWWWEHHGSSQSARSCKYRLSLRANRPRPSAL